VIVRVVTAHLRNRTAIAGLEVPRRVQAHRPRSLSDSFAHATERRFGRSSRTRPDGVPRRRGEAERQSAKYGCCQKGVASPLAHIPNALYLGDCFGVPRESKSDGLYSPQFDDACIPTFALREIVQSALALPRSSATARASASSVARTIRCRASGAPPARQARPRRSRVDGQRRVPRTSRHVGKVRRDPVQQRAGAFREALRKSRSPRDVRQQQRQRTCMRQRRDRPLARVMQSMRAPIARSVIGARMRAALYADPTPKAAFPARAPPEGSARKTADSQTRFAHTASTDAASARWPSSRDRRRRMRFGCGLVFAGVSCHYIIL
jgi:hypothetical protein